MSLVSRPPPRHRGRLFHRRSGWPGSRSGSAVGCRAAGPRPLSVPCARFPAEWLLNTQLHSGVCSPLLTEDALVLSSRLKYGEISSTRRSSSSDRQAVSSKSNAGNENCRRWFFSVCVCVRVCVKHLLFADILLDSERRFLPLCGFYTLLGLRLQNRLLSAFGAALLGTLSSQSVNLFSPFPCKMKPMFFIITETIL